MISGTVLLILAAGLPYYIFLEKSEKYTSKNIFLISATLLLGAVILSLFIPNEHLTSLVLVAFVSALFSIYKATKTTNLYKLGYYLIFINAPFFVLFEEKGALYSFSLLVSLAGIYTVARFYEKHYGSANYAYVRGITLAKPQISTFITIYLITLALYPPFPNAIFFLSHIVHSEPNLLWYIVVITIFFANFFLTMKVFEKSLFGKPSPHIHYVDLSTKDKMVHISIITLLLILSIVGLQETLV
jgi:hypothetical protein